MNNLISEDYLMHHGVKGMKWGVRHDPEPKGGTRFSRVVGNTYRINEKLTRNPNNKEYYKKTREDLVSGKVGEPRTKYQKFIRKTFGANPVGRQFSRKAVLNSKYLNAQGKAAALAEIGLVKQYEKDKKQQSRDEKRANRNSKIVNREIEYQKKKIADYEKKAAAYESSAKEVRKSGVSELLKQGYSTKDAKKATELVASRRETEAKWNRHLAKHYADYNKRLSEIDVSKMSRRQTWAVIQDLGNKKVSEVNSTWKEPESTKEYNKAKYGK